MMDMDENAPASPGKFPWQGVHPRHLKLHGLPRIPPSNDQAEMVLLGCLLANNLAAKRMGTFLRDCHFADPVHGVIFDAIMRRINAGKVADFVTLAAEFEHSGKLDEVGGSAYLRQITTACERPINPRHLAESITDTWLRRQVVDLGEQLALAGEAAVSQAFGGLVDGAPLDAFDMAGRLVAELNRLTAETKAAIILCSERKHALGVGESGEEANCVN